jgi:hypothetical protein
MTPSNCSGCFPVFPKVIVLADTTITSTMLPTVLVDTTLQIEQQKITPRPQAVRDILSQFRFRAGSTYSRFEAKNSWIKRLAYIHAESRQVESIPQLLDRITRKLGSHPQNHRKLTTAIEAISACSGKLNGGLSERAAMERFRYFVVDAVLSLNTWWDRSVHHEFDGTQCERARERPTFDVRTESIEAGVPRCVPSRIHCGIHTFSIDKSAHFQKIIDAVNQGTHGAEYSPELKAAAIILEKAKIDPTYLCNDQVCRKLGDCLIAVDGIEMSHFASTNAREWEPLSGIFEKQLVVPSKIS